MVSKSSVPVSKRAPIQPQLTTIRTPLKLHSHQTIISFGSQRNTVSTSRTMHSSVSFLLLMAISLLLMGGSDGFLQQTRRASWKTSQWRRNQSTSPDESAKMLTDYMAKAHEEKIRALNEMESKYKKEIAELKTKLAAYEGTSAPLPEPPTTPVAPSPFGSYKVPATNKELTEKVQAYHKFISDYVVRAQAEKRQAVEAVKEKYEKMISDLKA